MKRMHLHVSVDDLGKSIAFYSHLFGAAPIVEKLDYAKWMLDDPLVNFAISQRGAKAGLDHVGIQVDSDEELAEIKQRLETANMNVLTQEGATCCYAKSDKHWVQDPSGLAWETYRTLDVAATFNDSSENISANCCVPTNEAITFISRKARTMTNNLPAAKAASKISSFERNLTWWVLACIVVGIGVGELMPSLFQSIARMQIAEVNLPVAVLIWLMIIPMLLKIDFAAMGEVFQHAKGIGVTLFINWLVKPFSMALLGWFFIRHVFAGMLPVDQIDSYIAGLILLAAAPCTAMVFVWSNLCDGEPKFTLSQVAINDAIMLFAFAPIVAFLLGLSSITVPWATLLISVLLFIVVPVVISQVLRKVILKNGGASSLNALLKKIQPISLSALLLTLVLLFAFQGQQIINQPLVIAMLALPITIQVYFNSMLAYWLNKKLKVAHCVAGPSALIGASNFFELAVATAIALFGFNSGAALATVVGVLIEVPVMLSIVAIVNRSKTWYERV